MIVLRLANNKKILFIAIDDNNDNKRKRFLISQEKILIIIYFNIHLSFELIIVRENIYKRNLINSIIVLFFL